MLVTAYRFKVTKFWLTHFRTYVWFYKHFAWQKKNTVELEKATIYGNCLHKHTTIERNTMKSRLQRPLDKKPFLEFRNNIVAIVICIAENKHNWLNDEFHKNTKFNSVYLLHSFRAFIQQTRTNSLQ